MVWFWIGLGVGVMLATLLAVVAVRRSTQRVRRVEQRARASDRLAELGTLTGGLAHEIKNPLSTVGLNVQLLQEDLQAIESQLPPEGPVHEQIGRTRRRFESLVRETQRLREILDDFLRFAGRVELHRVEVNLHELIHELVDFFTPQALACDIRLRPQLVAQPATVWADTGLLKQAILNLLINATQAMDEAKKENKPHGGSNELIIRTERGRAINQKNEIWIHVTDTGPGVAPDKRKKIFHPYFSSKKRGTGLGLATTRRIIEEHQGHITVHSELGRGTDFVVVLPTDKPEATPDP